MLARSAKGEFRRTGSARFSTGKLSPVSIASPTRRSRAEITRASAGTVRPGRSGMISPGTRRSGGTGRAAPSRTTRTGACPVKPSDRMMRSDRLSTTAPSTPLNARTLRIATASTAPPASSENPPATASTAMGKVWNWLKKMLKPVRETGGGSAFAPCSARRSFAVLALRPPEPDVSRAASTSLAGSECHSAEADTCALGTISPRTRAAIHSPMRAAGMPGSNRVRRLPVSVLAWAEWMPDRSSSPVSSNTFRPGFPLRLRTDQRIRPGTRSWIGIAISPAPGRAASGSPN